MESTLLICTYNRSNHLEVNLSHILSQETKHKLNIIILDGSTNENEALNNKNYCNSKNIEYYHNPELSLWVRPTIAFDKIKTKTVSLHDDEDILDVNGFFECVEFLENNPKYVSACGNYMYCHIDGQKIIHGRCYDCGSIEDDNQIRVLWNTLYGYTAPFLYNVFETNNFIKIFTSVSDTFPDEYEFSELSINCITNLLGYHKRLYSNFKIRLTLPSGATYATPKPLVMRVFMPSKFNTDCEEVNLKFKNMIMPFLIENTIDEEENVLEIIASYYYAFYMIVDLVNHKQLQKLVQKYDLDLKHDIIKVNTSLLGVSHTKCTFLYKIDDTAIDKDDTICIYGAGEIGEMFYNQLVQNGKSNIKYFITSKVSGMNYFCNTKIAELSELDINSIDHFVLASAAHEKLFKNNLLNMGIPESKIIDIDRTNTNILSYPNIYKLCFS